MKLIAVTSPATDAGKTFIAAGIAEAATYHNLKTLFMDFRQSCRRCPARIWGFVT